MRVVLINPHYQGAGADRASRELFHGLQKHGVETEFLVGPKRPTYPPGVRGIRTRWEKYLRALTWLKMDPDWRHVGSIREFNRIGPDNCDIVHAQNMFGGWASFSALKKLARRVPLIWTFHDENPLNLYGPYDLTRVLSREEIDRRWGSNRWFYLDRVSQRFASKLAPILPHPTAIVCASRWLTEEASQPKYKGVRVHQLPYGLPFANLPQVQESRQAARDALGVPRDAKVVFIVAAHLHSPFKGMWLGIEALNKLKTANVHVLAAGISPPELVQSIKLPATYVGYVSSDAKMAQMYRAADITLLPSVADNFPYVCLESLACQTPVAAFPIGGLPEMIGEDRGLLARPLDSESLAQCVDRLLGDDSLRSSCGAAGRRWIEESCNVDRWVEAHLRIYQEAIADFNALRSQGIT